MLKSMTGYGKATCEKNGKKFTIEIKSLNGKQLDLGIRIPSLYREKENELRSLLTQHLERGKVDMSLYVDLNGSENNTKINTDVVISYLTDLEIIGKSQGYDTGDNLLSAVMRLPDVLKTEREELDKQEWLIILDNVKKAIEQLNEFRKQEGLALEKDILKRVELIKEKLSDVEKFEKQRIDKVRDRIKGNLVEFIGEEKVDKNRFEQEIIYFLEKYDITEEKVRLANHCDFFIKTANESSANGKKLGFISQEIGREINTIGSKANDSDIQKLVVEMKDELEKIKEQLLNVL